MSAEPEIDYQIAHRVSLCSRCGLLGFHPDVYVCCHQLIKVADRLVDGAAQKSAERFIDQFRDKMSFLEDRKSAGGRKTKCPK